MIDRPTEKKVTSICLNERRPFSLRDKEVTRRFINNCISSNSTRSSKTGQSIYPSSRCRICRCYTGASSILTNEPSYMSKILSLYRSSLFYSSSLLMFIVSLTFYFLSFETVGRTLDDFADEESSKWTSRFTFILVLLLSDRKKTTSTAKRYRYLRDWQIK